MVLTLDAIRALKTIYSYEYHVHESYRNNNNKKKLMQCEHFSKIMVYIYTYTHHITYMYILYCMSVFEFRVLRRERATDQTCTN